MRNPRAEGIGWQGQTQRKGLVELLVDEEVVRSLLEFLKSIELEGRDEQGRKNWNGAEEQVA